MNLLLQEKLCPHSSVLRSENYIASILRCLVLKTSTKLLFTKNICAIVGSRTRHLKLLFGGLKKIGPP
jgi:hypothetical protein